jgi:GNAT superfamily N-acetyltransferase
MQLPPRVAPQLEDDREIVTLRDGSRVTLRLVRPGDRELLRKGFERLSSTSRQRRFLAAKTQLSEAELDYFTRVDMRDHFAMGAVTIGPAGEEEGIAIARFIRSLDDPRAAEVAIAVVDDWQRKGLGTILLLRLVAAARERGIERFTGLVSPANDEIRNILGQLDGQVRLRADGEQLHIEVDLPDIPLAAPAIDAPEVPPGHPIARLFALIARGILVLRDALDRLAPGDRPSEPAARSRLT